jgi:hypothetical protein
VLLTYGFAGGSRQLVQSGAGGTGQVPVQGRVSIRESADDAGNSSSSSSSSGDTTALDNSGDIVVVGDQPADPSAPLPPQLDQGDTSHNSSSDGSDKVPTPNPPQGTGDGGMQASPAPLPAVNLPGLAQAVRPKLLIVLAAIVAPSCVALCAVCVAAGAIYKRRKQQDKEQQQQQCSGMHGKSGADNPASNDRNINSQAASKARWRLPSGAGGNINGSNGSSSSSHADDPTASRKPANSSKSPSLNRQKKAHKHGELVAAQPTPPILELSSTGGYGFEQQGRYNIDSNNDHTHDHPGEITASRIEFLDPDELQRPTTSSDGGNSLRHVPCRDSLDLSSVPEPGSHAANHKQGRLGSLAGSVAGMASSVAAAIGHRLRSSQAGAAYKVPGLEPAAARGTNVANRGSLDLQMPAGERGPTLPGARGASVLMPAAEAAELAAAVAQQASSSRSSKQQPKKAAATSTSQPAAVPAIWLLPTATAAGKTGVAAAGSGVIGGLQASSSRGPARAAAAAAGGYDGGYDGYNAVGLQEAAAGEVVGGSTFLLPSRSMVNLKVNSPTAAQQQQQQQQGSPRSPPAWG